MTTHALYRLPNINECINSMNNAQILSALDANRGYFSSKWMSLPRKPFWQVIISCSNMQEWNSDWNMLCSLPKLYVSHIIVSDLAIGTHILGRYRQILKNILVKISYIYRVLTIYGNPSLIVKLKRNYSKQKKLATWTMLYALNGWRLHFQQGNRIDNCTARQYKRKRVPT